MYNFPVNTIPSGPVNNDVEVKEDPKSSVVADRASDLAASGGVNPLETITDAEIGDKTTLNKVKRRATSPSTSLVSEALASGTASIEELREAFANTTEKEEIEQDLENYYIEQGILVDGIEYTPTDLRYTTNMMIAEQMFRDRISAVEEETGFVGKVGDFVDRYLLRQIPIGAVEDLTGRTTRKGQELLQAAMTMNPKEYQEFISNYIDELAEEGFFASNNLYAFMDGLEEATNAGYDPMDGFNKLVAIADLVPLASLATKGAGAVVKSKSIGKLRTANHADHTVGRVAALEGQEAAGEVAEQMIKTTEGYDATVKAKAGPAAFDDGSSIVRPSSSKVLEIAENNRIWQKIRELDTKGTFGRVYTPDQLRAAGARIIDDFKARSTNKFNNYTFVNDITNNPIVRIDFGNTKKGTPYVREADAQKALSKQDLPEGFVAPVDPNDTTKGYVIRVESRMETPTGVFDENAVEYGILRENLARVFGSNASLDEEYLSALANMGEAGLTLVKGSLTKFEKALTGLPTDSKKTISRVFKDLRDGPDAAIKDGYTRAEFKDKFKSLHPKGQGPTKKDMEAYDALVEFEDAGWLMRANEALSRYVKKDFWSVDTKYEKLIAKRVDDIPQGEKVFDGHTGFILTDKTKIKTGFWKLDQPNAEGLRYMTNPIDVKVLDHADVMGFNAGGRRINPKANYFVAFDSDTPRAFLTAFSEKQARLAVEQISRITNKIKELGGDISKIKNTDELDDLVRANNDWNTSITSFKEFAVLAKTKNWDVSAPVSFKERGQEVKNINVDSPMGGANWDEYTKVQLNRSNDTLMDFGGGEAYNIDPVSAIMEEFSNAATHYTHRAYTYNAAASWVKRAARKGSGVKLSDSYPKDDYLNQVQHAEITGSDSVARKLRTQRAIIRRRLKMKGPIEQRFDSFGQEMREFVFDKTGVALNSVNPADSLLTVGFQSAFGFFNLSQFFMQSMHATTVIAMSPTHGFRGAAAVIPLRLALNAGSPAAEKLAVKRLAKYMGETEETIAELVEYTRTAGRDIIGADTMELGTGVSFGVSNWGGESMLPSQVRDTLRHATSGGRKALDIGLIPFNQGERLSRMTGVNTAFFEFKKKFPNVSALSDEGRRWITNREQTLTFNMTASSRPMFQNGLMKVPTQWLSYSFRAAESVIVGRGLSAVERARLAAVLMPMYGLTGLGFGQFADYVAEKVGIKDPELYIGMKYGIIDYLISEITPVETAVATRLAPITAFTDLWDKVSGDNTSLVEIAGGPSGEITSGILTQFADTLSELYNGRTVSLTEDVIQVLRQPSGLDNVAKGIGILNNGFYRSKTGTILPIEMKTSDALIAFMGFSPLEVSEFYSQKSGKFNSDKKVRAFSKEMQKDYQRALQIWRDDPQRGSKMFTEIGQKIALSGFPLEKQIEIRQGLKDIDTSQTYYLVQDLIERDKMNSAMITEQLLGGN